MEAATQTQQLTSVFDQGDTLEVITFYVGQTQYATPVSEVRYIEQDKRKTTRIEVNEKVGAEVTSYQGKPVPIYDLANLMGCQAEYTANIALLKILKDQEKEHHDWMNALEACLRSGDTFNHPRDPNLCDFGKWYSGFQAEDELLADILEDFDSPHKRLHGLADELLALREDGEAKKAIATLELERGKTFGKLVNLFGAARDRLENITRPILLYIDTGHKMIAVRLNAISDIVTYNRADFTTQADVDDNQQLNSLSFFCGYLENKEDTPPCVLLDWRLFTGTNQ
jgi:chemotaxis signal transduction protein